jgi:hypothetical protein
VASEHQGPESIPAQIQVSQLNEAAWLLANKATLISRLIKPNGYTRWIFEDVAETRRLLDIARGHDSPLDPLVTFARLREIERKTASALRSGLKRAVRR